MLEAVRAGDGVVVVFVRAKPRAKKTQVVGLRAGRMEVALSAPPVDGAANEELERFFAKLLGVGRTNVSVVRGHGSREKLVHIRSTDVDEVRRALGAG